MSFSGDVRKFAIKTGDSGDKIVRAVTISLFNGVIQDNPVDTGRSRGAWETTVGQASRNTPDRLDKTGSAAKAEVLANTPAGAGEVTFLTNNLPYIVELEKGSSKQAPEGMVTRNMDRIERNLKKAVRDNKV